MKCRPSWQSVILMSDSLGLEFFFYYYHYAEDEVVVRETEKDLGIFPQLHVMWKIIDTRQNLG